MMAFRAPVCSGVAVLCLTTWCAQGLRAAEASEPAPAWDRFALTLEDGWRREGFGPFFYEEAKGEDGREKAWAFIPFYSDYENPTVESREQDVLYPLFSYLHYGREWRWHFMQVFSEAGGMAADDTNVTHRVTVYPFYFRQRSSDTNLNYTALAPFYGHVRKRLMKDEMFFVMFPFYAETRKKDVITENYLYPFGSTRRGDHLTGWEVWPLAGHEHKDPTTATNGFGDVSLVGGHDHSFILFPFWLRQDNGVGTDDPEKLRASFPFYVQSRSPQRDSTTVLFPMFSWIDDRNRKYHEWQGPWPLVIFTRGPGKTTDRVWPLFSQSHNDSQESDSYGGFIYTFRWTHTESLDLQRRRFGFYLYADIVERNTKTGAESRRLDMWPFFTWQRDFNGNERLQIFAPVEPSVPHNRGIERNWSPFWSLWREEHNPRTGVKTRSVLWNLYRSETRNGVKKVSLFFGLIHYHRGVTEDRGPAGGSGVAENRH